MIKRTDRRNNSEIDRRVLKENAATRYRESFKWIPSHIRNGRPVKAHYARIGNYESDQVTIEDTRKYGWERGPVIIRERKVSRSYRKTNDQKEYRH